MCFWSFKNIWSPPWGLDILYEEKPYGVYKKQDDNCKISKQ